MKERVLKLLKKWNKEYYKVWSSGETYKSEFKRDGFCNEWNYYDWAGIKIHHNIETDKITCYCDCRTWEER